MSANVIGVTHSSQHRLPVVIARVFDAERHPYRTYLAGFMVIAMIMAWPFLFLGMAFAFPDIGSDTFLQFYPLNVAHARQLAAGDGLTWSFQLGLGGYIGTHFDPFWMLQGLLPESMQLQARIYAYLLKLGLAGLFFGCYLRTIGFRGALVVMGGLAYAFSEYALVNGQWDLHGTELFHFAVLLCLLEKYLRTSAFVFPVLIGLLLGAGHSFNLYTSAFFTLLYIAARAGIIAPGWSARTWFERLAWLGIGVVLGVLVLAPLQLPSLLAFLDSPRVSGDHSGLGFILGQALGINDPALIFFTSLGLLGKGIFGVGDHYAGWGNYLEGPGFYVGVPFLLFASQLAGRGATKAERRLFWIALAGVALYVVFPGLRYAAFGFNHGAFRISTLWISMLILVVGLAGLRRQLLSGLSIPPFCLTAAGLIVAVLASPVIAPGKIDPGYVIKLLALTAVYALIVLLARVAGARRTIMAIVGLFAVELCLLARPALTDRVMVALDGSSRAGTYEDGTREAVEWIRARHADSDFYRVEKDYHSVFLLDSLVQGYRGVRSYFFHATGVTRFVDSIQWPRTPAHSNYIGADLARDGILDLLSVRYILSRDRARDIDPASRHLATIAGVEIYERPGARSPAVLHARVVDEAAADAVALPARDTLMLDAAIVDDLSALPVSAIAPQAAASAPIQIPVAVPTDTRMTGRYDSPTARVLAFGIPFAHGWQLHLDGDDSPSQLLQVNYGLLGAVVPAGRHTFELRYRTPGRWLAYRIAPPAILVTLMLLYVRHRKPRPSKAVDPEAPR